MIKSTAKQILNSKVSQKILGTDSIHRWALKEATVVFLYHEVSDTPSEFHRLFNLYVTPEIFEGQIMTIRKIFDVISAEEFLSGRYKRPAAMITFDDGAASYFENAVPILTKYHCPSVIFLNMAPIDGEIFWSGLVTYLCEHGQGFVEKIIKAHTPPLRQPYFIYIRPEDINSYLEENNKEAIYERARNFYGRFANRGHLKDCQDNPLVKFGNHLYNHYNCAICREDELTQFFTKNQMEIEKYPNAIKFFSYPFGQRGSCYNEKTTRLLRKLGAQVIFAAQPQNFHNNNSFFYRLPVDNSVQSEDQFKFLLTSTRIRQFYPLY
jgi:peptidoglycan/xylan/chitin deacetylase (PgdA/CDA1 family)